MSDTPNKNNNSNRNTTQKKKPAGAPPANKKYKNNKKKFTNNKNRRPKALTPARLLQKYDNLLEQYLIGRRKYFDMHGRANPKQLDKITKNYQTSLKNLRTFEEGLQDWQKEVLKEKINAYPADRQFTSDHSIEPIGDEVSFVGDFEDPHLLPTQKAEEWSKDTEESSGSIDDYNSYKGIVAQ